MLSVISATLGQNATFFRGTLEKMPSKDLQNCPRNVERSSSSEDSLGGTRTAFFSRVTRRMWHLNIITQFLQILFAFKIYISIFFWSCYLWHLDSTKTHNATVCKPWHFDCRHFDCRHFDSRHFDSTKIQNATVCDVLGWHYGIQFSHNATDSMNILEKMLYSH